MERALCTSLTPQSVVHIAQGVLGPSTDNGMSKMPPTVRRDERDTHSGKMQVNLKSWFSIVGGRAHNLMKQQG